MDPQGETKLQAHDELQALYERVVAGDRIAPSQLVELIWKTYTTRGGLILAMKEKGWIRDIEEARDDVLEIVADFATKFVADLVAGNTTYDPTKGTPLGAYITMALNGDIANEAEKRRRYTLRNEQFPEDD